MISGPLAAGAAASIGFGASLRPGQARRSNVTAQDQPKMRAGRAHRRAEAFAYYARYYVESFAAIDV